MQPLPKIAFVAPIIRAAIAQLETYMPLQVDQFNAEPENVADLAAPATYHFGGEDLLNAHPFPQVEVAVTNGDTGNFAIARSEVDHDPRLLLAFWLQGDTGAVQTLYEQTVGLIRCAIECITPPNVLGAGVEIAQRGGISWRADVTPNDPTAHGPADGRNLQKWLGSGLLVVKLETVEHFT